MSVNDRIIYEFTIIYPRELTLWPLGAVSFLGRLVNVRGYVECWREVDASQRVVGRVRVNADELEAAQTADAAAAAVRRGRRQSQHDIDSVNIRTKWSHGTDDDNQERCITMLQKAQFAIFKTNIFLSTLDTLLAFI